LQICLHSVSQGDTSDFDREFKDKIEYNISSKENSLSINEVCATTRV
jgi:hypothetical protein